MNAAFIITINYSLSRRQNSGQPQSLPLTAPPGSRVIKAIKMGGNGGNGVQPHPVADSTADGSGSNRVVVGRVRDSKGNMLPEPQVLDLIIFPFC